MGRVDRVLIAIGCGLCVAGWATRRVDILVIGAIVLVGYYVVRLVGGPE